MLTIKFPIKLNTGEKKLFHIFPASNPNSPIITMMIISITIILTKPPFSLVSILFVFIGTLYQLIII